MQNIFKKLKLFYQYGKLNIATVILIGISSIFSSSLIISKFILEKTINSAEQNYYNQQLQNLLKTDRKIKFNNNLLASKKIINNPLYLQHLGGLQQSEIYFAKYNNITKAVIIRSRAPDGYNGNIDFFVAITGSKPYKIINVSILQHQETPGLGDNIEASKTNWLIQFKDKANNNITIDSITGATITSLAVTNAIRRTLQLIEQHENITG